MINNLLISFFQILNLRSWSIHCCIQVLLPEYAVLVNAQKLNMDIQFTKSRFKSADASNVESISKSSTCNHQPAERGFVYLKALSL